MSADLGCRAAAVQPASRQTCSKPRPSTHAQPFMHMQPSVHLYACAHMPAMHAGCRTAVLHPAIWTTCSKLTRTHAQAYRAQDRPRIHTRVRTSNTHRVRGSCTAPSKLGKFYKTTHVRTHAASPRHAQSSVHVYACAHMPAAHAGCTTAAVQPKNRTTRNKPLTRRPAGARKHPPACTLHTVCVHCACARTPLGVRECKSTSVSCTLPVQQHQVTAVPSDRRVCAAQQAHPAGYQTHTDPPCSAVHARSAATVQSPIGYSST
jgi:hypothetical protein